MRVYVPTTFALVIDVLDAECGIDGCLVGIGRRAGEIVQLNRREELILRRDLVIETQRELVGICGYL